MGAVVAVLLTSVLAVAPAGAAEPTGEVHGEFVTSTGDPSVAPAQLYRRADNGSWELWDTTYFGDYDFTGVPDGTYRLYLFRDGDETGFWWPDAPERALGDDIVVADGATVPVSGSSEVGATIQGRIRGPRGRALMDRPANAYRLTSDGRWARVPYYDDQTEFDVHGVEMSRRDGRYQLRGLAPGRYTVFFGGGYGRSQEREEWWDDVRKRSRATVLRVHDDDVVSGINAHLEHL